MPALCSRDTYCVVVSIPAGGSSVCLVNGRSAGRDTGARGANYSGSRAVAVQQPTERESGPGAPTVRQQGVAEGEREAH